MAEPRHGDAVIDALTWPTRLTICAVLLVNMGLGLWLVSSSDFSGVLPQGAGDPRAEAAPRELVLPGDDPAIFAQNEPQ